MNGTSQVTAESVAAHYDDLDRYYRLLWGEHLHHGFWRTGKEDANCAIRQMIDLVAETGRVRGAQVCDVGCGYGGTSRVFVEEYDATVTGLTLSEKQCEYARGAAKRADNPRVIVQDWLTNNLPDSSFDCVVAIESLAHMTDKAAFFHQAQRVLRPGGRLVVCAWLSAENPRPWQRRWLLDPICREGRLPAMGTESSCRRLIQESGLVLGDFKDLSHQVRRTWSLCIARAIGLVIRHPSELRFLFDRSQKNRVFFVTLFRLWLAYRTRSIRYGLLVAQKRARNQLHRATIRPLPEPILSLDRQINRRIQEFLSAPVLLRPFHAPAAIEK